MDTRITRALDFVDQHLDARLPIETLAAAADLSPSRFAHLFRHEVGTSPALYVHALRMLRARALLERSFLSVKEVMTLVGCHDPSHFSRDFRWFHGLSPRQCRLDATRDTGEASAPTVGSQTGAAIEQIAALANEQRTRTRKLRPRARAPDGAAIAHPQRHETQSVTSLQEDCHVTDVIGVCHDVRGRVVDCRAGERADRAREFDHRSDREHGNGSSFQRNVHGEALCCH